MRYYLIAGEASGDLHGSNLLKNLLFIDPDAEIRFWGGNKMESVCGLKPVKHYKDLAFMGFVEVLANLRTIIRNLEFCKKDIESFNPEVIILIDYPGFNLRIAEFAAKKKIKVAYYISPQIWAWKESRVYKIKKSVHLMMVILPFEESFYKKHQFKAHFVGHPLLDYLKPEMQHVKPNSGIIALLPGSRKQEIEKMLPVMLKATHIVGANKVIIAATSNLPKNFYTKFTTGYNADIEFDTMHQILKKSDVALVTSGTATLETALLSVPQVVCYKTSNISYQIARRLVNIRYISLVNLIMDKPVVKEMIQGEMTPKLLSEEIKKIIPGGIMHEEMMKNYSLLPEKLGGEGASKRAAQLVYKLVNNQNLSNE